MCRWPIAIAIAATTAPIAAVVISSRGGDACPSAPRPRRHRCGALARSPHLLAANLEAFALLAFGADQDGVSIDFVRHRRPLFRCGKAGSAGRPAGFLIGRGATGDFQVAVERRGRWFELKVARERGLDRRSLP